MEVSTGVQLGWMRSVFVKRSQRSVGRCVMTAPAVPMLGGPGQARVGGEGSGGTRGSELASVDILT